MRSGAALVVLLACGAGAGDAQEPSLVGAWRLKSFVRVLEDGSRYDQLGKRPDGYLIYSADGRMSVLFVDGDRASPKQTPPTDAERAALHGSMLAYAGSYRIEGDKVIHHLEIAWDQSRLGSDQVRFFTIEGRTLTLRTPPNPGPLDGKLGRGVLTFEKFETR